MHRMERMALSLYAGLMWAIQPLLRAKLRRRARLEPPYAMGVDARFGHYHDRPSQGWVWVHAVSLGETHAAGILVRQLRTRVPGMRLLLTHGTAAGWLAGTAILAPGDRQEWLPWDTRDAVARFVLHFRPAVGLLMETEIWPNLVQACGRQQIPLYLVNARKSLRSFATANRKRLLAGPAYRGLSGVLAQASADASKLAALGAPVIAVTGNIKFDAHPVPQQLLLGRAWRRLARGPVLMLASSREGEEAAFVQALRAHQLAHGSPTKGAYQLLIVPRHIQRADVLTRQLQRAGWSVSRRSQWTDRPEPADIWLGDTMGELALYYALSDVALLGGSFAPFGGQNLIEAAACACPIVLGPHTFNFDEAAQWALAAGAAKRASGMHDALVQAFDWIEDADALTDARKCCLAFTGAHHGATARTATAVLEHLQARTLARVAPHPQAAIRPDIDLGEALNMPAAHQAGVT